MAHGGTQNAVPPSERGMNNYCNTCGVHFDSSESLQVHIHNNHNQPVSAAADSSDNQPPTPQSNDTSHSYRHQEFGHLNQTNYQTNEMHYPSYMASYDQYYHQHSMEYGLPPSLSAHYLNNPLQAQHDYKSNRFHPYNSLANNLPSHSYSHAIQNQHQNQNGTAIVTASAAVQSPSAVTSSSPIQNNLMHSTTSMANQTNVLTGQPTPSPSPRQCDKCGIVCETIAQLNEHHANAHSEISRNSNTNTNANGNANPNANANANGNSNSNGNGNGNENDLPTFQYTNFGQKDEQQPADCDILDLDSQKMVYPHELNAQGPLPPMHSLHPMQRMWPPDTNNFLNIPQDKSQMFSIKTEFTPQIIKQDTNTMPTTPTAPELNKFPSDGNQTSPSEFPTTTTPQENAQFRTFEATSSLPNGAPLMKAGSWKSNEARRPKTYNCTACNKWFTSSGHLKRHYNTTLHKNAVKSSGQPDPATLPISAHHHPARDPNTKQRYNKNNNNNAIAQTQHAPSHAPPSQTNDTQQFATFSIQPPAHPTPIGFQQYQSTQNATVHPNAQAGLCGPHSQPRDLLTYTNIQGVHSNHMGQDFIQVPQMQPITESINNTMDCNIITPITINTNTQLCPLRPQDTNYIIGNQQQIHSGNSTNSTNSNDCTPISYYGHDYDEHYECYQSIDDDKAIKYSTTIPAIAALRRLNNDIYHADTVPPFSPDIPDKRILMPYNNRSSTPQTGEIVPAHLSPNAPTQFGNDLMEANEPSSPSITSTANVLIELHTEPQQSSSLYQSQQQHEQQQQQQQQQQEPQQSQQLNIKFKKTNKRRQTNDTAKLITDTIPTSNDPLRCDPCDKVFNKACYLTQHNKTFHSGEKPFKCQRCGKRFPCDQSHTEHMAKHNGNKPFKCNQCIKQFNHKTDLRRHMCLHTGTKPYICEICNKGFIRKDHMVKHGLTHLKRKNDPHKNIDLDDPQLVKKRRKNLQKVKLMTKRSKKENKEKERRKSLLKVKLAKRSKKENKENEQ